MMKRLDESLPDLVTTRVKKAASPETGTPPSETGSAKLKTLMPSGVDLSKATDETLMELLQQVLGSQLVEQTESLMPDYGYDFRLKGFKLAAPMSSDQMARARTVVAAACRPLPLAELTQELTKLRLLTFSSLRGPDLEGWMTLMSEELEEFPAAVVIGALKRLRHRGGYLPCCAEIVEECHQLNQRRRALRRLVGADRGYGNQISNTPRA